jgi:DNA-binding response OmpR family regulator
VPRRRIVLLVEPDQRVRADFAFALEARGFQVWAAADGPSGLALARNHLPGVIVGDFPLAQAAGSGFTTAVRSDAMLRDAVIITVTDRILTEKDSVAWLHSDRVLAKPIEASRLAEEVAWAVERKSPQGSFLPDRAG